MTELEAIRERLAWYAQQPGNVGMAADVATLFSEVERLRGVVTDVRRIVGPYGTHPASGRALHGVAVLILAALGEDDE